ncbi:MULTISPECIES: hypothetical protein [Corynebacterium]|uniref:hypothetical protein n=1 Tax=Corynebacterium TaxID=1716 RepID=UPI0013041E91|nr:MULTISPECIES: hypothetical protein [Corynebacterium]MCG7254394.1 hypothetical protein [Corynebacterium hadale]MCG7256604.1 hypothetical protein [Corynebacterium hadale]MCG7264148.1 hypothetical protein [Corynebacterium hadale]WJZ13447.1 hypothetical protein CGOTT_07640 [Corynebacterium gottingense]WJZ15765.1 hypothetical protein CGOTTB_07605 [Corynebacterium gottingense]
MFNVAAGMWVVVLFLLAGLLAGGVWSAYQHGSKAVTIVLALLAALAFVFALFNMAKVV